MATPLELLNQASYNGRRRGVTYMPQVRLPPPARRGPPITPRLLPNQQIGQGGGGDWVAPNFEAIANYAAPKPQAGAQGDVTRGLGWIIGNPVTRTLLKPLEILDYPRATVNALVTELAAEAIQRMPDAEKYKALDTDFSWGDIGRNIKEHKGFGETLVEPIMGPEGDDWNIWVRRALGFAGDIATDPLMKLGAGVRATTGAAARMGYAEKLLSAQEQVARQLASNADVVGRLTPTLGRAAPQATGYGAAARQAMERTLAGAEQAIPELTARQGALGTLEDIERLTRRGVAAANPEQLATMGLGQHGLRFADVPIADILRGTVGRLSPATGERAARAVERVGAPFSRGITRMTGPVKERISASGVARGTRALRTAIGEGGQDLSRAYERALTGRGQIGLDDALRTIAIDQAMREGGSTFRGFASHAVRQLDNELQGMDGAEREALMLAADQGTKNAVSVIGPKMVAAAKQAGVDLPVLEGQPYVPHVLTREAFNFLDRMRQGKNQLVDEFRRRIGITNEDLLEEGGFLQRRSFRPELQPDGTLKPQKFKIGDQEIIIERGDLAELEEKLGGLLRSAGFEGKLYETDPVTAYKRYVIATERDVAKRYAAKKAVERGYKGFYRVNPDEAGPAEYRPVIDQDILPRAPGEEARTMVVRNPQAEPEDTDLFKWVTNEEATAARNREIAKKAPRGKQAKGKTQREIQAEYEALGQAQRENIAAGIDKTATEAWTPHRKEMAALKDEMSTARAQVQQAEAMGGQYRARLDQIDDALAEADREIASLHSRIGGITRQARRRVDTQSQMMLDDLTRELDAAQAQRVQLMKLYEDAMERAGRQLPAAERRAAVREVNEPIRRETRLRKALAKAKKKTENDRKWAENYLRGESVDPKTGRSRWISQERIKSARARLDDPKLQRQYNALVEERQSLVDARLRKLDEASELDRKANDAINAANKAANTSLDLDSAEEIRLLELADGYKRQANAAKAEAIRMLDTINGVQQRIQRHRLELDRDIVRLWEKQEANIDKFSRDLGIGARVDVALARRQERDANLALQEFLRQKEHEAAYQAAPPPASLTEYYEREVPQAKRVTGAREANTLQENRKRLREVQAELKDNPEPTLKNVTLPDAELKLIEEPVAPAAAAVKPPPPAPVVPAAATVVEEIPTLKPGHMGMLYLMKTKGDVQIATTAEAKRLVDLGLVVPTQELPKGFRGNIGNSKRWKLTAKGKEYAKRIELEKGKYTLRPAEAAPSGTGLERFVEESELVSPTAQPELPAAPEATPTLRSNVDRYEMKVGDGELDRYLVERVALEGGADGDIGGWAFKVTHPGSTEPNVRIDSLKEVKSYIKRHREMTALGEARREWRARTDALQDEHDRLRQWLNEHELLGERVSAAERTIGAGEAHAAREKEIAALRETIGDGRGISRLNARDDLERALQEPEPKWDPDVEKRADFDARHDEWEARQKSAKSQLSKVKRQLRGMGDKPDAQWEAQRKLVQLQAEAAREFENVPKAQRPPWYQELEDRNAANIAKAADQQAMWQDVARKEAPRVVQSVVDEKMAAAKLGRAAGHPGEMIAEGAPGYNKPLAPVSAGAEETAEGIPTNVEGITLQTARGTGEAPGAMPQIAAARQRIDEIHAGVEMNKAEREVVEEAQAAWFAPYNQGVEDHRAARARYGEIEARAKGVKRPRSAQATVEGKRGGRPYGTQLSLVSGATPQKPQAAGNLAGLVGSPAYEAQPMHATLNDVKKLIAANPNGDDELMLRIEAEVGNHLTHLDKLTREYDIPAHQLKVIIKEAEKGTLAPVLMRQLQQGFEYMWTGGDIIIDKELRNIYFNVAKQLESKLFGRTFTMLTDFFKTYATLSPGFHVRNALSAIFMNSSEGVAMATQRDGVKLWRQFIEAPDPVAWMKGQDDAVRDAFRATFASGAGGQFMERGVSELRQGGLRMSERVFANKVTRLSQRIGADWVEGPVRLGLALDSTRGGMSTVDAINRITRVHFDYGQVSRFDEKMKRIIPFWTFMSRNVPLQFTQMWSKPRTYLKYQSFVRNAKMGVEEDPLIPNYILGGGGFDTGIRTPEWLQNMPIIKDVPIVNNLLPPAGMPVVLQPDLPHARLQDDLHRMQQALSGNNPGQLLSNANPYFTAPFEYAMGKDFFTGKNYGPKDWSQAQGAGVPLAMLLSLVGGGKQGADGNWYMQDKSMNFLRSLLPPLDRQSRLAPGLTQAESKDSDRMLESYLRFMGGPVRTISEEQKRAELARRYYRARDVAVEQAATGG